MCSHSRLALQGSRIKEAASSKFKVESGPSKHTIWLQLCDSTCMVIVEVELSTSKTIETRTSCNC
jgi:hypothetical protein